MLFFIPPSSHRATTNISKSKARGQSVEDPHPLFGCRVFRVGCRIQTAFVTAYFAGLSGGSQPCTRLTRPIPKHIYQPSNSRGHPHASVRQPCHVMSATCSWTRLPGGRPAACHVFLATNSWSVYRGELADCILQPTEYRNNFPEACNSSCSIQTVQRGAAACRFSEVGATIHLCIPTRHGPAWESPPTDLPIPSPRTTSP